MDDTVTLTDDDLRAIAAEARRLANEEFEAWECGWVGGLAGRDPAEDVRVLELELGRALTPDERRGYAVGHRVGCVDRVREQERAADAGPPDWAGVPL